MSLLELGGRTFAVPVGEVTLGSDAACAIPLPGAGVLPRHAVLQGQPDGQVVIRKATPAAEVLINGVRLGAEPTPCCTATRSKSAATSSRSWTSAAPAARNSAKKFTCRKVWSRSARPASRVLPPTRAAAW